MNSARRERSFSLTIRIIIRFSHTISLTIRIVFRFSHTITVTNIAKQSCQLTTLTTFSKFPPCLMNQTASQQVLSQRATPYQTFNPPTPPPSLSLIIVLVLEDIMKKISVELNRQIPRLLPLERVSLNHCMEA